MVKRTSRTHATSLQIKPFPQQMRADGHRLDEVWMPFFARQEWPLRIVSMTQGFDLTQPKQEMDRRAQPLDRRIRAFSPLAQAIDAIPNDQQTVDPRDFEPLIAMLGPEEQRVLDELIADANPNELRTWHRVLDAIAQSLWRRPWTKEYSRMYEVLMSQVPLRALRHYLLAWLPSGTQPELLRVMAEDTFQTSAFFDPLPSILPGIYTEQYDHLAPKEPHLPLIALLTSYGFKGTWGAGEMIHRLLDSDLDIAVAIDVQVVNRTKAEMQLDFAIASRTNSEAGKINPDAKALVKLEEARKIQALLDTQSLHQVVLTVAVQGRNRQELELNVQKLHTAAGSRMKLMHPKGGQAALLEYFTPKPSSQIDAFVRPWRMPSAGVATMVPYGLRKSDRTDGWMWMLDGDTPIMFDPFKDNRPGHAVFLGKTGIGKSFGINTLLMRMAALGHRIILFEPQGRPSRQLIAAAGQGGRRYQLDMRQQINILDIIATSDEEGNPPSIGDQVAHVITQIGTLLGTTKRSAEGATAFQAREFSSDEIAILSHALGALYQPHDLAALEPEHTPILSDLVVVLQQMASEHPDLYQPEASNLARSIRLRLTEGPVAATFNARTSIDWQFGDYDITAFSFASIPDEYKVFYYGQAFGAVNRFVRNPTRSRERKTIVVIDEFNFMAQVPSLITFAAMASKTWRTFGTALWTADQDAITYIDKQAVPQMRMIFDNAPIKMIGLQDITSAEALGEAVQGLTDGHVDAITRLGRGAFVQVWDGDDDSSRYKEVVLGRVEPTDAELRAFSGT
jgi:hypothetical protein